MSNIGNDLNRFKEIIKNRFKHNLGKYVSSDKLLGQQGSKKISIPIDSIDMPRFIFGSGAGGAGQGDGEEGDPIDGSGKKGKGKGQAGNEDGEHAYIAEFTPEELAKILGEELNLPDIEDKGKGKIKSAETKYTDIARSGAEGLKSFKRTYKEALKRSISSGSYDPINPKIIPIKEDRRYKSAETVNEPDVNTVVIYMMDISGSMGDEQKHIVKSEVFWIDLWLQHQYKGVESRFVVHDTHAQDVSREEFFTITESGGTIISSAYEHCAELIEKEYPFSGWNVYPFHFSDGDNWGDSDNTRCIELLRSYILPNCNAFSYGQVTSDMGSGDFINTLFSAFTPEDNITLSRIDHEADILASIKTFFGKGK